MTRVLLIAEAANPNWASVPLVGFSLASALKSRLNCHIVTHVRNKWALLDHGWRLDQDFSVLNNEWLAGPFHRLGERLRGGSGKGWTTVMAFSALSYYAFEYELWRKFHHRLKAGEFDLVHRITPLSPTIPSLIASKLRKIGVPFIVGPLNGGLKWPPGSGTRRKAEKEYLSYVRALYKLLPYRRSTLKYAAAIIAGSRATEKDLPSHCQGKVFLLPENGIDLDRFKAVRQRTARLPIEIVFVGRLVPYKCPDILLRASAEFLKEGSARLTIIGDGPERSKLEVICQDLGITQSVRFTGWLPHSEIGSALAGADLMVLPSIREFGGGVVLEAMAAGVAPMIADYGGPSELVTPETAFRVPFSSVSDLEGGLQQALKEVIENPHLLDKVGALARQRVERHFTWDVKARQTQEIYDWVLSYAAKPEFGFARNFYQ